MVTAVEHYILASELALRLGRPDEAKEYRDAAEKRIGFGKALYEKALHIIGEMVTAGTASMPQNSKITVSMSPGGIGVELEFNVSQLVDAFKKRLAAAEQPKQKPQQDQQSQVNIRHEQRGSDLQDLRKFIDSVANEKLNARGKKLEHRLVSDAVIVAQKLEQEGGSRLVTAVEHYLLASEVALQLGMTNEAGEYRSHAKDQIGYGKAIYEKAVSIAEEIVRTGVVDTIIKINMKPMGIGVSMTFDADKLIDSAITGKYQPGAIGIGKL